MCIFGKLYFKLQKLNSSQFKIFLQKIRQSFSTLNQQMEDKPKQNFARRDRLVELEKQAQKKWEDEKTYESNPNPGQKKYLVTFPYPYLNGRLHLGHSYTMTKVDFIARYKRLNGFNVVFPFGFHCTGQPISAAATKLRREIEEYGLPPVFPEEKKEQRQWNILKKMGIPDEDIPKFQEGKFWCGYFHPFATQDLKSFGVAVDHRRSFITTDVNPYYDSFIQWQFTLLKERNYIRYGKRPSIFSVADNQICADHDRAQESEGIGPQEYTLIKLKVLEFHGALKALEGRNVYLAAATLRPETMYGQTNCYILPDGVYGAFEVTNDEVFIVAERAAKNMAYQDLTKEYGKYVKIMDIKGTDLLGIPLKAPLSTYEKVYALPMLTISMEKGTGVVTSVPSDSPDDYAALRDLKNKAPLREKYGIKEEHVLPFEPVPIINIPELGDLAAIVACEKHKVASQNDKENLKNAKDECYLKGFYDGVMKVGKYAGVKVQDAKNLVKNDMLASGEAAKYWEPEGKVISRSGDECIVALMDQWYLAYDEEEWKKPVRDHVKNVFNCYNDIVHKSFIATVEWLQQWGCSRSFGLGSYLPFDKNYLVESLSDSTIYMAYYTVVHLLQGNVVGSQAGPLGINPDQMNREFWDYVFLNAPYSDKIKVEEEKIKQLRESFRYWYPLDLRGSAKDLVKNHLTMCIFNHAAIWKDEPNMWPRSFFVNGYMLVDGEKMSKQKGNFFTLKDIVSMYGADACRFALSEAGDTQDDANFEKQVADNSILKISTLEMWLKEYIANHQNSRTESPNENITFFDKVFENQIKNLYVNCIKSYEDMRFRDVAKFGFHEFGTIKEEYLINCGTFGPRKDLILTWIQYQLLIMYPIIPHFCEMAWVIYFLPLVNNSAQYPATLSQATLPEVNAASIDAITIRAYNCLQSFLRNLRVTYKKSTQTKKGAKDVTFTKVTVIYAPKYPDWQQYVLNILNEQLEGNKIKDAWKVILKEKITDKNLLSKSLQFASFVTKEFEQAGKEVLESTLPFNEIQLLQDNKHLIQKELKIEDVNFISVDQAESLKDKTYAQALQSCVPGKAQVVFA
ncbi:cytoplasmic leucyl-tRNA synthetase (macronuclear) [Tetrahymena thermophila SB210]|uniref:leucine--tRNA ligase n=1 Tax=Tetrahymena thermophila (strain SB210) TaxID=312017 RepID=I7LXS6_TETTS|nr:cytoplasmic leucyl-tRNA synthetase [Tetrahymena thermophila SB210]EAS06110.2 cytoplasmic leucyl-tRNA synthetase [Tetrahymena thermophila SB210]|eukprot:XP_001026355.2 cytoplasmic leucyl-tRNA synthetase [Tetrahymena thermophila SB210]